MTSYRYQHLDIARGISLLFILMAHSCGFPFIEGKYIITYFVAIFFVVSGYLQSDKYSVILLFKKRVCKILIPYFTYNFLILFIYSIWHGFQTIKEFLLAIAGIFYSSYCLYYPVETENNILFFRIGNDPLWFLTAFFCANVLFIFYLKYCTEIVKKIIFFVLCILLAQALTYLPFFLPWNADKAFIGVSWMIWGYELKNTNITNKFNYQPVIIKLLTACLIIFTYITIVNFNPAVNLSLRAYGENGIFSAVLFVIAGFAGSLICVLISKLITYAPFISTLFAAIGREGLAIMSMHLILFRILDSMILTKVGDNLESTLFYWLIAMLRIVISIGIIMAGIYGGRYVKKKASRIYT